MPHFFIRQDGYSYLLIGWALTFAFCMALATSTTAQDTPQQDTQQIDAGSNRDDARVVYDQAYFSQFNAITAEDLLIRVPGIQDILREAQSQTSTSATVRRGFGSTGDQILIDGRRLSGKANTIAAALQRIQADQVERVEVIRGTAADLDVRTEGIVVNIVLMEGIEDVTGTWQGSVTHFSDGDVKPGAQVTFNSRFGRADYTVSLSATPRKSFLDRFDLLSNPGMAPFRRDDEEQTTDATDLVGTVSLRYTFADGNRLQLNGRYADEGQKETIESLQFDLLSAGEPFTGTFFNRRTLSKKTWEIGGDYEHVLAGGDVLKGLFLINEFNQNDERTFTSVLPEDAEQVFRRQLQDPDRSEKILRGSYQFNLGQGHTIEAGAELAINTLNQRVQLFTLDNGVLHEEPDLFNPDAKIDERRVETFTSYTWQPSTALQFDGAVDTEYSRLRQRGSVNRSRTLFYVRPRLDVRYDLTPLTQIRGRIERTITQLDFANFTSGFNTDDNTSDVLRAGNTELVPEKAWEYDITFERRLRDDQGVLALSLYYFDIEDHIDEFPVGDGTFAAVGNIGGARQLGAEVSAGLRLGWLGLPDGSIDAKYTLRDTSTTDVFDGRKRRIDRLADRLWSVSFRNDMPWRNLSYGVSTDGFGGNNISSELFFFDAEFIDRITRDFDLNGFVELRILGDVTLRFDVTRIIKAGAERDRLLFFPNRSSDMVAQEEFRFGTFHREMKLSLRGSF